MTARQVRRQEERKARKEAFKAQKQTEQLGETAAPPSGAPPSGRLESDRTTINRANAQLSTGPKTPEGKRISSRNSFKHGLYSRQLILAGEDPSELDALRDDLRREHQPATPTEDILVNELAEHYWRVEHT